MHVVTGVTGNTGAVVADALLAAGERVRVVLRDPAGAEAWRARGAEIAIADLGDDGAMAQALRDARAAYLLNPPDYRTPDPIGDARRIADALAAAADRAALPHAVVLSSFGAHRTDAPGMLATTRIFEQRLSRGAGRVTVLRAASFMETSAPMILRAAETGTMPSLVALDVAFEQVAAADVAAEAAAAMRVPPVARLQLIELAGPRAYSANDMAATVAAITGRPTRAVLVPPAERVPALVAAGMGPAYAAEVVAITDAISDGRARFEGSDIRRGPTMLDACIRRILAVPPRGPRS